MQFTSFLPAISKDALKKISAEVRSWRRHRWVSSDGREIAELDQPENTGLDGLLRRLLPSALYPVLRRINTYLMRWVMNKYKMAAGLEESHQGVMDAAATGREYFAHWAWVKPARQRPGRQEP